MKLTELRSAIRKMKGNPSVIVELTPGKRMVLVLQKTPTLDTLGSVYADEVGDIGLTLDEAGVICGNDDMTEFAHFGLPLSGVPEADFAAHEDLLDDEDML